MNEDMSGHIEDAENGNVYPQHEDTAIFPIDDEFTARDITADTTAVRFNSDNNEQTENDGDNIHQSSISELDDRIPEEADIKETVAVDIPEEDDDESISPISKEPSKSDADKKERPIDSRFDFLELFVFTMVTVLILTTFIFRHSIVDGGSMEQTLYNGEHLIISDFFYTPKRSDVIVFQDYSKAEYSKDLTVPLVKRIIAIGGDTVRVYRDGRVYVNDMQTPLDESEYVYSRPNVWHLENFYGKEIPNFTFYPSNNFPEYIECKVPEGEVFVMGDHRDASTDSRVFGTVKESTILGRVLFRFYPFEVFGKID